MNYVIVKGSVVDGTAIANFQGAVNTAGGTDVCVGGIAINDSLDACQVVGANDTIIAALKKCPGVTIIEPSKPKP